MKTTALRTTLVYRVSCEFPTWTQLNCIITIKSCDLANNCSAAAHTQESKYISKEMRRSYTDWPIYTVRQRWTECEIFQSECNLVPKKFNPINGNG